MKLNQNTTTGFISALAFALLMLPASSQATIMYETTLNLTSPVVNSDGIDRIVYDWSTNETAGFVNKSELVDLKMTLFNGASVVSVDTVLAGGIFQGVGGTTHVLSDLIWQFNLNTMVLHEMRNISSPTTDATTGTVYQVNDFLSLPDDSLVAIRRFDNGSLQGGRSDETLLSQSTRAAVSEPATLALLGLGIAGIGYQRRMR